MTDKDRENREKFRQALADLGHPEATFYSHWALEAYDNVYFAEYRKNPKLWHKDLNN